MIGFRVLEAEVIGGAGEQGGGARGKIEDGNGAKENKAKTPDHCRFSLGFGAWAGWLAGWPGWAGLGDVELELDDLTRQDTRSQVRLLYQYSVHSVHPSMQPIPVPVSCLSGLISLRLLRQCPCPAPAALPHRPWEYDQHQHQLQERRPKTQDPRQRPS